MRSLALSTMAAALMTSTSLAFDGVRQQVEGPADAAATDFRRVGNSETIGPDDRAAIIDTITDIAAGADRHQWDRVRGAFADNVTLDYTSLWGGAPATQSADEVVKQWSGPLTGFDRTLHLVTNHAIVKSAGATATAEADFQAVHRIGDKFWVLMGRYRYDLTKVNAAWKVSRLVMTYTHETGDRGLVTLAAKRADERG
ncbi:nuclear transport factor 2 family protein [Sinorhizobium numidicum]|uniref:Nuclear transport factor 2 family protein n=1 Tax=Sinorhizobium numidicum TaxID=680248 RepID=A0ABY8CML4_9HYPH|nr:nuclear transport factor 2 family protein [Sinorhizobium numidicum]WEX73919.1 nuclear transport factor 2 family protein [Sinorhizobium numidicum]WEX79904.1 nuclear transport factor 2 family protein [Sinorhizobium numidicum]